MQRLLVPARTLLAHRSFVVLLVCNVLLGLAYSFIGPFISIFGTQEVGMSTVKFSAFMTITALSAVGLSTALARWSDIHFSRRAMLLFSSACGALGYVGYAFARDMLWLTVIGSTVLAVSSITFSQLFAHARELLSRSKVPAEETPLYLNVFRLFFSLSWTVGPAVAAWVMELYSFRVMFLIAAGIFGLLWLVVLFFVPGTPPAAANEASRIPLRQALRNPELLVYFAGFVMVFTCLTMGMMNLPLLVLRTLGGTGHEVGIIYSIAPVFELPFMFYFGLLASRGDQTRIIRLGVIIAVVYYALLSLVRAPWHIYPLQILSAAMIAIISGVAITFFQNYLPGQAGTATNLYANAQRIGSTAGYLLFGVADALGYQAVFYVCTGLCAVTLILFHAIRPRPQPPRQSGREPSQAGA
jgi:SET family sugar efflux transporter-like MFS transporter